jgi:hypothetical protein
MADIVLGIGTSHSPLREAVRARSGNERVAGTGFGMGFILWSAA